MKLSENTPRTEYAISLCRDLESLYYCQPLANVSRTLEQNLICLRRQLILETQKREQAEAALKDIGDFAHDRSTGPAVEDALWEIRRMAYEAL